MLKANRVLEWMYIPVKYCVKVYLNILTYELLLL